MSDNNIYMNIDGVVVAVPVEELRDAIGTELFDENMMFCVRNRVQRALAKIQEAE